MALGDTENFRQRLRQLIPYSWFPNPAPILWGALSGYAYTLSSMYAELKYAKAQTRMATATDAFLDIAAQDYTGTRIQRRPGETDASFRDRIIQEVLRIRLTPLALLISLMELTGRIPEIIAPWDTQNPKIGALDYTIALAGGAFAGVGGVGSMAMPYIIFINVFRPLAGSGIMVSDAEIYSMISNVKAAGIKAWVSIQN